ncbi:hypothetical protein OG948_46000 (plasmid) [Embleya sp. NBC_00888]|uniref:hypothetical protein n=1 Tax=Embleya sp. NBC_00888 TaxID=2975960 RepID=UPI0038639E93|nr:hypothetical protein OG948_46000 [Embleya sp. NBC_00888]
MSVLPEASATALVFDGGTVHTAGPHRYRGTTEGHGPMPHTDRKNPPDLHICTKEPVFAGCHHDAMRHK